MVTWIRRVSRAERQLDASMERFVFRHRVWGFLMIAIGMPAAALAAVCAGTAVIALPIALVCGWV